MPRKNRKTRQRPQASRILFQRSERQFTADTGRIVPASKLADLVKPDAICHGNPTRPKHAFITEGKAAQALANARKNHKLLGVGKLEERYYTCQYGTDKLEPYNQKVDLTDIVEHFHLTSQPARPESEESS